MLRQARDSGSRFPAHSTTIITSILVLLVSFVGCRPGPFVSYVEIVESTKNDDYVPLPVVFVPGIKGTELIQQRPDTGPKKLWGLSGHVAFFRGFDELALNYETVTDGDAQRFAAYYRDRHIYPGEILISYGLGLQWFTFLHAAVYKEMNDLLTREGGFRAAKGPRGRSLFFLPYDWRLDNRIAAVKLAAGLPAFRQEYDAFLRFWRCERVLQKTECSAQDVERPDVQAEFSQYIARAAKNRPELFRPQSGARPEIRFNLVAHSMGGLVAQYFIAQLGGDEDVHRFVTFGTPSRGAMDSLKAFSEGEYPETLWSNILGAGFYPKRATNYITMSFPSVYQLLPRYPRAVSGVLKAESLGLAGSPSAIAEPAQEERIWQAYRDYELLPDLEAVGTALGRKPPRLEETVLRKHLQAQLRSAACFHEAMDGVADPICEEEKRKADAVTFLEGVYRDRSDERVAAGALKELRTRLASSRREKSTRFGGRVVYGGHCQDTITRVRFIDDKKIEFLGSSVVVGAENGPAAIYAGDGRVPVDSADFRRPNEDWRSSFFLCESHLGLVKNDSFKYNLLRVLLSDFD
jgi:hypothetical protein